MAYLLDTNVLSDLRVRARTNPNVIAWASQALEERHFVSVITLGEIRKGIEIKRRKAPDQCPAFESWLSEIKTVYEGNILEVTEDVMETWGRMMAQKQVSQADSFIAATAIFYDLTLVTRNVRDFENAGIDLINPFEKADQ